MWMTTTTGEQRGSSNNFIHNNEEDKSLDLGRLTDSSRRTELWQQQTDALIRHYANRNMKISTTR
jgi:hypothetical protein